MMIAQVVVRIITFQHGPTAFTINVYSRWDFGPLCPQCNAKPEEPGIIATTKWWNGARLGYQMPPQSRFLGYINDGMSVQNWMIRSCSCLAMKGCVAYLLP
eukprot:6189544-Pleurochrysis_carterae.AAC.1